MAALSNQIEERGKIVNDAVRKITTDIGELSQKKYPVIDTINGESNHSQKKIKQKNLSVPKNKNQVTPGDEIKFCIALNGLFLKIKDTCNDLELNICNQNDSDKRSKIQLQEISLRMQERCLHLLREYNSEKIELSNYLERMPGKIEALENLKKEFQLVEKASYSAKVEDKAMKAIKLQAFAELSRFCDLDSYITKQANSAGNRLYNFFGISSVATAKSKIMKDVRKIITTQNKYLTIKLTDLRMISDDPVALKICMNFLSVGMFPEQLRKDFNTILKEKYQKIGIVHSAQYQVALAGRTTPAVMNRG
jgi:hypothetical protein